MDGAEFARELVGHFGEDRFYHCYMRTGGKFVGAVHVYTMLGPPELPPWKCVEFFKSIGVQIDERLASTVLRHPASIEWGEMCMVAYGFCKHWKEMGRKTPRLPANLHARMILGEKNEWVEKYVKNLEELEAETDQRP